MPPSAAARPSFRRWYERRLYESFAWLTLCILSGIGIGAVLDLVPIGGLDAASLLTLGVIYLLGLLGLVAWRRFWLTLKHAQRCASGAVCAGCGAYGRFEVRVDRGAIPATCTRCGHRWTIE